MDLRLLEAANKGDTKELKKLLQEDSFMLERGSLSEYFETVLHVSTMAGQTDFVKEILKLKPDFATRLNKDGFSPLHIASAHGNVEIVKELLRISHELGRLRSSVGRSSLHFAATTGRVQVIKELLGFCPECKDDVTIRGQTALHFAVKNNQFEAFRALVDMHKQFNIKELLNVRDEDGNTILHLATARKQYQTLKLLLGGDDIEEGAIKVNVINRSGLTALDVLDFVQQMLGEPTDYKLRELLLGAGALRAAELECTDTNQTDHSPIREPPPQNLWHFLLKEVSLLSPFRLWKMLAKEVKHSPSEMQNALLVVAVLIATMTYQAILNPPGGFFSDETRFGAMLALSVTEFIVFMAPNSIGFVASLAVIILVLDGFPLKPLLGLAVRCMAANYVTGLLIIGPTAINATRMGVMVIGIIVSVDLVRFSYWVLQRWTRELRSRGALRHGTNGA